MSDNLPDQRNDLAAVLISSSHSPRVDGAYQSTKTESVSTINHQHLSDISASSESSDDTHTSTKPDCVDLTGISDSDSEDEGVPLPASPPPALQLNQHWTTQAYSAHDVDGRSYISPYARLPSMAPTITDFQPAPAPPGISELPKPRPRKDSEYTSVLEHELAVTKHKLAVANHSICMVRKNVKAEMAKAKLEMDAVLAELKRAHQESEQVISFQIALLEESLEDMLESDDEGEVEHSAMGSSEEDAIDIEDD